MRTLLSRSVTTAIVLVMSSVLSFALDYKCTADECTYLRDGDPDQEVTVKKGAIINPGSGHVLTGTGWERA